MEENKIDITKAIMNVEYYPAIFEEGIEEERYTKLPISQVSALGVAFEPLATAFKNILSGGKTTTGVYKVTVPKGTHLAARKDGSGYISSVLSDKTNQISGQATLNPLVCDPTTLFMLATLTQIDKKLDSIQEMQQELLDFLVQKERSELKGDLNFLSDVINNYKYNWDNDKYKNSNHIKVLDIMQSSERKIDFYQERIASKLKKKSYFHSDQEVRKQLNKRESEFKDYQVSLYVFAFSSFLQVMLLENFDSEYLNAIAKKIEDYSFEYRQLYTKTFAHIEKFAHSSIQSSLIKGLASVNKMAGEAIAKVPVISKSQIDETLIEAGEKLEDFGTKRAEQTMQQFLEKQSTYVRPFIDNINIVNALYNEPLELLFDKENIYIGSG